MNLELPDLSLGEIIIFFSHGQVTNDMGYNVSFQKKIMLNDLDLTEEIGGNVTPDVHHGSYSLCGSYKVETEMIKPKLRVVACALSTRAIDSSYLKVDRDYGRLSCVILGE